MTHLSHHSACKYQRGCLLPGMYVQALPKVPCGVVTETGTLCVQLCLFVSESTSHKKHVLEHLAPSTALTLGRVRWLKKRKKKDRKNSQHLGLLNWSD